MLRNSKRFTELAPGLAAVSCATIAENDGLDPIDEPAAEVPAASGASPAAVARAAGEITLEVPRDWLGYELGRRPATLHPVGRIDP